MMRTTPQRLRDWIGVLFAVASMWCGAPAMADSWALPTTTTYHSNDGLFRFTVTPREIGSPLGYFEDEANNIEPSGQAPGGARQARGRLERLHADGRWTPVWDQPLVNDVSPVNALIADGGAYVVTFDNWHSIGFGDHVVVIYGPGGELGRSLSLTDILPEPYLEALPRTVSSLRWSGEHRIAGGTLILEVLVPNDDPSSDVRTYVEVYVDLASGAITPRDTRAWEAALAAAERRYIQLQAANAAERAQRIAPLLGPETNAEEDWHEYLREAYLRLTPAENAGYPATKILRAPDAEDYAASLGWLRDALLETRRRRTIMIASPSQENLSRVIGNLAPEIRPGSLRGSTVYLAVDDDLWPGLSELLASSGAYIIQLDPSEPIPQRRDRLPN